ncbi:hypothetical protein [Rhodopseudomonas sp. B29]|uniref:hypothetical protein n=1 Tax=Rhodopseudomonas sp. B29 TaxID=95607 RepID=UPI0003497FA4|nr:hypothetical protein [Rhodopseudomonas sp. B29]
MRHPFRTVAVMIGAGAAVAALAGATVSMSATAALAQAKQAPAPEPQIKDVTLTEKQIQNVLAGHKEIDAIAAKLPDDPAGKPDPKILKQADDVAKKYGFASFAEYGDVVEAISMVLAGVDAKTKKYVGPEAELKSQIAAVQADTKMSADDKKEALASLNEALKNPGPPVTNQTNIDLVTKNYDQLADALEDDE